MKKLKKNYAFVDGSFNQKNNKYGCGVLLIDQNGKKHTFSASANDPYMAKMRNVAGELMGAKLAIEKALILGMKTLTIFYDYDGIGNWATGKWNATKRETKDYVAYVSFALIRGLDIYFQHVKGHTGILENEEVDRLAKEAVGLERK